MHHTNRGPRLYNSNRRAEPVEDLREKLNRKRQENVPHNEAKVRPPPPDPAYNFLRDPLRGDECKTLPHKKNPSPKNYNASSETLPHRKNALDQHNRQHVPEQYVKQHSDQRNRQHTEQYKQYAPEQHHKQHIPKQYYKQQNAEQQVSSRPTDKNSDRSFQTHSGRNRRPTKEFYIQNRKPQSQTVEEHIVPHFSKEPAANILVQVSGDSGERKCTLDNTKTIEVPKSLDPADQHKKQQQRDKYIKNSYKPSKTDEIEPKEEASATEDDRTIQDSGVNEIVQAINEMKVNDEQVISNQGKVNDEVTIIDENNLVAEHDIKEIISVTEKTDN